MATRLTLLPFEFSDRTSESSTEALAQLQPGEVSVHTALQLGGERGCCPRPEICTALQHSLFLNTTLSIPDPISPAHPKSEA